MKNAIVLVKTVNVTDKADCDVCVLGSGSECEVECNDIGYMYKLKNVWVQCTKDNISVGDTVRFRSKHTDIRVVKYILNNDNGWFVVELFNHDTISRISDFEVKL